jgi:hypothetical protein
VCNGETASAAEHGCEVGLIHWLDHAWHTVAHWLKASYPTFETWRLPDQGSPLEDPLLRSTNDLLAEDPPDWEWP